jgi:hypothetical protein
MPPLGIRTRILVSERPQTQALYRAATGIGTHRQYLFFTFKCFFLQSYLFPVSFFPNTEDSHKYPDVLHLTDVTDTSQI